MIFSTHFHLTNPFELNVETHMFGNSVEYLRMKRWEECCFNFNTETARKVGCY